MGTLIQPIQRNNRQTAAVATAAVFVLAALVGVAYLIPPWLADFRAVPTNPAVALYGTQATHDNPAFPVTERAAATLTQLEGPAAMRRFFLHHVQRFPDDPYNGYFLLIVGESYRQDGATALARDYYRRALFRYPAIEHEGQDSHFVALNRLLSLSEEPNDRIGLLNLLMNRYPARIDVGHYHFQLGQAYAAAHRWEESFHHYRAFIAMPNAAVPGRPQARLVVEHLLTFHESSRDWTHPNLNDLVTLIKRSLANQDSRALLRYRAKVNFFSMSWEQEQFDFNSQIETFDIGAFLRASRVRFADNLDIASNAREAYLRTWGWSHRIPTWYLYFRRVDYPSDPTIHGNWEWAGVYFGDVL